VRVFFLLSKSSLARMSLVGYISSRTVSWCQRSQSGTESSERDRYNLKWYIFFVDIENIAILVQTHPCEICNWWGRAAVKLQLYRSAVQAALAYLLLLVPVPYVLQRLWKGSSSCLESAKRSTFGTS
jgi:hypothetical protein